MKQGFAALSVVLAFLVAPAAGAYDLVYVRQVVKTLTSAEYWGRGYTKDGMGKAAEYLAAELRKSRVPPVPGQDYLQPFVFGVNTFPSAMRVNVNGTTLVPGVDYIVASTSRGARVAGTLSPLGTDRYADASGKIVFTYKDKLTWSVGRRVDEKTEIFLDRKRVPAPPTRFEVDVENRWEERFRAANVIGYLTGTERPEDVVVLSAHYDHLGGMGTETYFPGANDNASGTAFLLSLAKYYAANPPTFSVAFLFFAAEEAGLVGSQHFVNHPTIPLARMRFVMNFDLVGTGEDGATVVNATEYPAAFETLQSLNARDGGFVRIHPRGKARNSDHYWFSERGVPAFFFYTMGGIAAYHDVDDRAETLPMNKFRELFALTLDFNSAISGASLRKKAR